jgi:hypothetical protein
VWRDSTTFAWVTPNGDQGAAIGRFAIQEMHETRINGQTGRAHVPFGISTEVEAGPSVAYVGTNESYEIRVIDMDGRLRNLIRLVEPARPVPRELTQAHSESTAALTARANARRSEPYASNSMPVPYPKTLPFYSAIKATANGYVWVKRYHPWDEGIRLAGQPSIAEWDVFGADGRWLVTVEVPYALSLFDVGENFVLGRWRDSDGVEFVHVYEVRLPQNG